MRTFTLLFSFALLGLGHLTRAQSADTVSFTRHQLGIIAAPVYAEEFTSRFPLSLGLLYRLQYREGRALRLGATAAYESKSYLTTLVPHPAPQDSLLAAALLEATFGHEWRLPVSGPFSVGYGLDASAFLLHRRHELDNILIGNNAILNEQIDRKWVTVGAALQPFLHFGLEMSPRLYLVAEAKAEIGYSRERFSSKGTWGDVNERPEERGTISGGAVRRKYHTRLRPLASLQLNFRL